MSSYLLDGYMALVSLLESAPLDAINWNYNAHLLLLKITNLPCMQVFQYYKLGLEGNMEEYGQLVIVSIVLCSWSSLIYHLQVYW